MLRAEAISRLRAFEPQLKALGASGLFLFGSTAARGDQGPGSDLDLFLDTEPQSRFTILDLVAARRLLMNGISTPIDLTTRDALHPRKRDEILSEAVQIF